jgi:hypothetical protein
MGCGRNLRSTKATGKPQAKDHEEGCWVFSMAVQVMRYAQELERAASAGTDRRQRRYLQKSAKALFTAACVDDVRLAIRRLARRYEYESQQEATTGAIAEMLMRACLALAQGEDPAPIPPSPKH